MIITFLYSRKKVIILAFVESVVGFISDVPSGQTFVKLISNYTKGSFDFLFCYLFQN